ncbi:peptide deformylase [Chitinophaga vietnamensis]|uniref:peptide deformylase n=1 Tax=Chitinophaga vietnamensis TaxID=2593957 RepID=UPI0011776CFE|nr:peptide deformylase [Chitinophaga vietnamensis]
MILPIVAYGSNILRRICDPVTHQTPALPQLTLDMWDTLRRAGGVGLAAPQLGKALRLFVINSETHDFRQAFLNPVIIDQSETMTTDTEGCLSIPGIWEDISRPESILIRYEDENFIFRENAFHGDLARMIQHEYDHINGKLMIDYLPPLRKQLLQHKLKMISTGKIRAPYPMK